MAKRRCTSKKTVRVKGHTKKVCASYTTKRKAGKKKCVKWGRSHGKKVCRKYGSKR